MTIFVYSHTFEFIHSARSHSFIVSPLLVAVRCCCVCFGFLIYIDAVFSIALETNFFPSPLSILLYIVGFLIILACLFFSSSFILLIWFGWFEHVCDIYYIKLDIYSKEYSETINTPNEINIKKIVSTLAHRHVPWKMNAEAHWRFLKVPRDS